MAASNWTLLQFAKEKCFFKEWNFYLRIIGVSLAAFDGQIWLLQT